MIRAYIAVLLLAIPAVAAGSPGQGHGINWSWTLSVTAGVTSQHLYCGTTAGGENWTTPVATLGPTVTSYLQPVTDGVKYYCAVTASIGTIEGAPSAEASATAPFVPVSPTSLAGNPQ